MTVLYRPTRCALDHHFLIAILHTTEPLTNDHHGHILSAILSDMMHDEANADPDWIKYQMIEIPRFLRIISHDHRQKLVRIMREVITASNPSNRLVQERLATMVAGIENTTQDTPKSMIIDRAQYIIAVLDAWQSRYLPEVTSAEFAADVDSIRAEYNAIAGKNGIGFDGASQMARANFIMRVIHRTS